MKTGQSRALKTFQGRFVEFFEFSVRKSELFIAISFSRHAAPKNGERKNAEDVFGRMSCNQYIKPHGIKQYGGHLRRANKEK